MRGNYMGVNTKYEKNEEEKNIWIIVGSIIGGVVLLLGFIGVGYYIYNYIRYSNS